MMSSKKAVSNNGAISIKLNVKKMKEMMDVLNKMEINQDVITLKIKDCNSPLVIEAVNGSEGREQRITGLVMPVRS